MAQSLEKPQGYLPRAVDGTIDRYLKVFGAVEIAGTKWCGKTWTALEHGASASYVDDNLELAEADPSMMLLGQRPHVIDEWQRVPAIWDSVRREVDRQRATRGAFILTGSSTPALGSNSGPVHSGAGRIGRVRMHPMSLAESNDSAGAVSLKALFDGKFTPCAIEKDTLGLIEVACRGGWPEAIDLDAQLRSADCARIPACRLRYQFPRPWLGPRPRTAAYRFNRPQPRTINHVQDNCIRHVRRRRQPNGSH